MKKYAGNEDAGPLDFPSVRLIQRLLRSGHPVVVTLSHLCNDSDRILRELAEALPDCRVYYGSPAPSPDSVMKKPTIESTTILSHANEIHVTIDAYIETCTMLHHHHATETLSPDWSADEHGEHCRFENRVTGQVVEAPFANPILLKHVDPYFFALFVKSTHSFGSVAALIKDELRDSSQILDVLFPNRNDTQQGPRITIEPPCKD
jgi:hypothetical protein